MTADLSVRRPVVAGVTAALVLVLGFGLWAALTRISGAIVVQGQAGDLSDRQVVQHPDGGVVSEILVKEGDTVEPGQLLIRLDAQDLQSELAVVEGQLLEVLARRARFEAERDDAATLAFDPLLTDTQNPVAPELMEGQERLFEARKDSESQEIEQLSRRREQIADQIDGIRAQQAATEEQIGFIEQELVDQQSLLDRGLAQAARVLALAREKADLEGQRGELIAGQAQAEGRITETDIEILRIGTTRREEAITRLRDLQFNEIELGEKRRQLLSRLDRLDIRAPVAGVIYGMQVFAPRSVIRPADAVLYIVPQDRPLVITAQILPIHIDQIHVGQEVALRFSAFDQRRTPELFGQVVQVSADAFTDQQSRASYYRAEIALNEGEIDRLPAGMTLIPGMPVEAYFGTDARTPFEYLLKPFLDYFTKAFRES